MEREGERNRDTQRGGGGGERVFAFIDNTKKQ